MPKKRKNSGKRHSGKNVQVQCSKCGRQVPRSKATKVSRRVSLVDGAIAKELRAMGTVMEQRSVTKYLCVSCAIHTHTINIRSSDDRKERRRI
ncbi:MAG: 30S ribosomal protein S26e [Promethearchaeota archaeon]